MNLNEYSRYDAVGLAELVRNKDISADELAQLALSGVEKVNPALNAVIEVYRERADGLGEYALSNGPFAGVPFFLKDLGPTEIGKKCEWGSRIAKGVTATSETNLTKKIREAGLNTLGRTACPEFGFAVSTESLLNGITRNPWNADRTPGGSSGGSTSIVAAGVVPMAHTNDGAGSTRVPASMCGLVGLKCSRGRISLGPGAGDVQFPLYSEFVASRTVRDTAAALDALSGPMPGETTLYDTQSHTYSEQADQSPSKLRIAMSTAVWGDHSPSTDVITQLEKVGQLLIDMGHDVVEATPPIDFADFHEQFGNFFSMAGVAEVNGLAKAVGKENYLDCLETVSRRLYEHGRTFAVTDYLHCLEVLNLVSRQLGQFYTKYDLLLTPTTALATPTADVVKLDRDISIHEYYRQLFSEVPYTPLNNFTGTPAISLPLCTSSDGMPLGAHFMAPMGEETRLLRLAFSMEAAAPWIDRRPATHVASGS